MVQPYTLTLERTNSGGSSHMSALASQHVGYASTSSLAATASAAAAAVATSASTCSTPTGSGGGKERPQITVHTTMAHHLASKLLLQKQPSLDDRRTPNVDSLASELGKFVRRQGSVESPDIKKKALNTAEKQSQPPSLHPPHQHLASDASSDPRNRTVERKTNKHSMINLFGALTAIEQDDVETLRVILAKNCFVPNDAPLECGVYAAFRVSLQLLDVALMMDRRQCAAVLLRYGASADNEQLSSIEQRRAVVAEVLDACMERLRRLREKNASLGKEEEKRARTLDSQVATLQCMSATVERQPCADLLPGAPANVRVYVSGATRATVEFCTSSVNVQTKYVVIKYKVEWSRTSEVCGRLEISDMRRTRVVVDNLEHGAAYTFRIAAASMYGYGPFEVAAPTSVVISSWEDLEETPNFRQQQMCNIAELFEHVERHRQSTVWQRVFPLNTEINNVKKKKSGIRYLFSASSKFVKNVQRGVYLASIIYTESKVLCTVDDCLPVLCVDETAGGVSNDDMHWLMKLSLCWDQVPYLLDSMNSTSCSNSSQLRAKILDAVTSMMNALGVRDIGRMHHVPLNAGGGGSLGSSGSSGAATSGSANGSSVTFLVSVNLVNENQAVQGLAMRWMRMEKLVRKRFPSCPAMEYLNRELFNILNFFESSQIPLDPGLYLCYLRLQSSLNVIRVTVPENIPSVLPFALIRDNAHVSREEWEWLWQVDAAARNANASASSSSSSSSSPPRPTQLQYAFHQQLGRAASVLINDLDMDTELIQNHRLFRLQVLQLHSDVSFILIVPRAEDVCHVTPSYGVNAETHPNEHFKACTSIPVPVFQMINLFTYQPDFITAYCRLNIFLEHFIMILQCEHRQCLLANDAKVYADQLEKLADYQQRLDEIWRSSRWISKCASVARDRQNNCTVPLAAIIAPPPIGGGGASTPATAAGGAGVGGGYQYVAAVAPGIADDLTDVGYHSDQSADKLAINDYLHGGGYQHHRHRLSHHQLLRTSRLALPNGAPSSASSVPVAKLSTASVRVGSDKTNTSSTTAADDGDDILSMDASALRERRHSEKHESRAAMLTADAARRKLLGALSLRPHATSVKASADCFSGETVERHFPAPRFSRTATIDVSAVLVVQQPENNDDGASEPVPSDPQPSYASGKTDRPEVVEITEEKRVVTSARLNDVVELSVQTDRRELSASPCCGIADSTPSTSAATTSVGVASRRPVSIHAINLSGGADRLRRANSKDSAYATSTAGHHPNRHLTGSPSTPPVRSAIVRVFVGDECGLESGASVGLRVTDATQAREVTALVVEQIAKVIGTAAMFKHHRDSNTNAAVASTIKPVNGNFTAFIDDYCLVSVVDEVKERRLSDDFPLLRLQTPWNAGRLYVRRVSHVSSPPVPALRQTVVGRAKSVAAKRNATRNEAFV